MVTRQRFRYSSAITVAAVIVMISGLSLAAWAPYLLPVLVLPLAVAVWSWRAGTDADPRGLTVRAALFSRRLPWPTVSGLVADERGRVSAQLTSGRAVTLPAVSAADLSRLVAASGQQLVQESAPSAVPAGPER
jgi:Bacterial PH domain